MTTIAVTQLACDVHGQRPDFTDTKLAQGIVIGKVLGKVLQWNHKRQYTQNNVNNFLCGHGRASAGFYFFSSSRSLPQVP